MSLDLSTLTKGQTRKLNALRKSLGNEIADDAFASNVLIESEADSGLLDFTESNPFGSF